MTLCYHPSLVPTQWGQQKPEPNEMVGCACGANMACPVCGYGWGTYPHTKEDCHKRAFQQRLEHALRKHKEIYAELAQR